MISPIKILHLFKITVIKNMVYFQAQKKNELGKSSRKIA